MYGKQFLSIRRQCSGAPGARIGVSLLYCNGTVAMCRGGENVLVYFFSAFCLWGHFENDGSRRQYQRLAPLSRG